MASVYQKNIWAPEILSIEDLISQISGLKIAESLMLLIELYQIHLDIETQHKRTFDEFMGSGMMMIHDFNDVDIALADGEAVFSYLSEAKAISRWSPEGEALSENEKEYLRFYAKLKEYYLEFNKVLLSKKLAYQGMAYRYAAENTSQVKSKLNYNTFIFAGFNALSPVEEKLFEWFQQEYKAQIFWDVDDYFLNNPMNEAGKFLRNLSTKAHFEILKNVSKDFMEPKKVNIIGVPRNVGQAKAASGVLAKNGDDALLMEKTALVLADENLLFPVLNSIPSSVNTLNLTMGFPLRSTPMFSFFNKCFQIADNALRYQQLRKSNQALYYFKDMVALLQHPYIRTLFAGEYEYITQVVNKINTQSRSFYTASQVQHLFAKLSMVGKHFIDQLFEPQINPSTLLASMQHIVNFIREAFYHSKDENTGISFDVELEYLFHFHKLFNSLAGYFSDTNIISQIQTLKNIFEQICGLESVAFYGEPLQGLQVLGLLETRTLDFENVILLSANEGVIPSAKHQQTFIPQDIRAEFGLQTLRDKESVMAYHFYHLIQRAKNVFLIYNSEGNELGGGEKSRFIMQILHELPKYNPQVLIEEQFMKIDPRLSQIHQPLIITKTTEIYKALFVKASVHGISPTSLNTYLNCSLQFYFRDILKLQEAEEMTEEIDKKNLGIIMHEVLENLFLPYNGLVIKESDFKEMQQQLPRFIDQSYNKHYSDGDMLTGRNRLTSEVIKRNLQTQLEIELSQHQSFAIEQKLHSILALEQQYEVPLLIQANSEILRIKVSGKCDRIDKIGSTLRIIDYKTGKVEKNELSFESMDLLLNEPKLGKSFQLLMYAYLFSKNKGENIFEMESGVVSVGNQTKGFMKVEVNKETNLDSNTMGSFEEILKTLLSEIMDKNVPFQQVEDVRRCKYCPYLEICNRNEVK